MKMVLIFDGLCKNAFAIIAVLVILFVGYFKWMFKHWKRLGVPFLKPSIPFGNMQNIFRFKISFGEAVAEQYRTAKSKGYRHVGLFGMTNPEYMPIDPDLLKNLLVKDFAHFSDRGYYVNEATDPLSSHLFLLGGQKWKHLRAKLTPTFTSGKIKNMLSIVLECGQKLKNALDGQWRKGAVDIKHFLHCFGTDTIGSCAFGLDCDSFNNPSSDLCVYSKRIFEPTDFENLKGFLGLAYPAINRFFKLKIFPAGVTNFFLSICREVIEYRKANNVVRNDFMQILIELMKDDSGLTIEKVAAQSFVFFVAGFETSSTTLTFCLLELASDQDVQQKLRKEVNEVLERHNQVVTYEGLKDLVYMRQVLDEVLRKYPPIPVLHRVCTMDYEIPNSKNVLKKGTRVAISLLGLHYDPDYFPDPEKFDPDRFAPERKEKLNSFCYMPFGEGPRQCIGMRFAFLQIKIALILLLKNYKFTLNDRTLLPVKLEPKNFILTSMDNIWLNVEKI